MAEKVRPSYSLEALVFIRKKLKNMHPKYSRSMKIQNDHPLTIILLIQKNIIVKFLLVKDISKGPRGMTT